MGEFLDSIVPPDWRTCDLETIRVQLGPPLSTNLTLDEYDGDENALARDVSVEQSATYRYGSEIYDAVMLEMFYGADEQKRHLFPCPSCEQPLMLRRYLELHDKAIPPSLAGVPENATGALVLERWDASDAVHGRCLSGCDRRAIGIKLAEFVSTLDAKVHAQARSAELQRYSLKQLDAVGDVSWIVDRILVERGLTMLIGDSNARKTMTTIHMLLCVAAGIPYFGHKTIRTRVFLVLLEGSRVGHKRWLSQTAAGLGIDLDQLERGGWLYLSPEDYELRLDDPESAAQLDRARELFDPGVFAIDCLNKARTVTPGSENDSGSMTLAMDKLEKLSKRCAVLLLAHTGKNGEESRGSSAIKGNADKQIMLSASSEANEALVTMKRGKDRDGAELEPLRYRFRGGGSSPETAGPIRPTLDGDDLDDDEPTSDPRRERILAMLVKPSSKDDVYVKIGGRKALAVKAFAGLVESNQITEVEPGLWQRVQ